MPFLSTIIPHQGNDSALENTILSVLENQPTDCEVIVVHDGSYSDPYQLGDELLLIEERTENPVRLLNAGLVAACAPVVCVLSGGAVVADNSWADAARRLLETSPATTAALAVETHCGSTCSFGISEKAIAESGYLQRGQVDLKKVDKPAGPNLICGFYDRRTMLALDGWNEQLSWENADVELALLMSHLGIHCELADVQIPYELKYDRLQTNAAVKQMAEIAVAYGLSSTGASAAMTDLLRGCLSGNIAGSVAWATGIVSARRTPQLQARRQQAQAKYEQLMGQQLMGQRRLVHSDWTKQYRRAG